MNGDRHLLADLAGQFLRECPAIRIDLKSSLAAKEFEKVRKTAHSLKSVVGIFGAEKAAGLLQKLEAARGTREAEDLLPQVLSELERVEGGLAALPSEADLRGHCGRHSLERDGLP